VPLCSCKHNKLMAGCWVLKYGVSISFTLPISNCVVISTVWVNSALLRDGFTSAPILNQWKHWRMVNCERWISIRAAIAMALNVVKLIKVCLVDDRLCGLVVRLSGCRPRGHGFDSRRCQIFWVTMGLERGPLSPYEEKWGATWKESTGSGLENWD
jgi:hypothetical protein